MVLLFPGINLSVFLVEKINERYTLSNTPFRGFRRHDSLSWGAGNLPPSIKLAGTKNMPRLL